MIHKRYYAETVLLDQAWIHDASLTVGKALAERDAEVLEFVRYAARPGVSDAAAPGAAFERVLVKLSGEALLGDRPYGIDPGRVQAVAAQLQG